MIGSAGKVPETTSDVTVEETELEWHSVVLGHCTAIWARRSDSDGHLSQTQSDFMHHGH